MTLVELNAMVRETAVHEFKVCLGCLSWAEKMADARPFDSVAGLINNGIRRWRSATEEEILEAFTAHPQIGDLDALRNKYANTAKAEQGQISTADEETLIALRDANQTYLTKFGFIFIVCATGKSATKMLELLQARIPNNRASELVNGAHEQWLIAELRLNTLFTGSS
ncbi:MAG: 2-oxo-4-hydroxy-4-carboxy-5-ureidoimidazoline decarboxylase [Patiriisocius sp.]|jgi:2-oxo-4-hydroxy-4-carboxy-5-ureidoimidazoline decarboxylase